MLFAKKTKQEDGKFGNLEIIEADTIPANTDTEKFFPSVGLNPEDYLVDIFHNSEYKNVTVQEAAGKGDVITYVKNKVNTQDNIEDQEDSFTEDIFIEDNPTIEDLDKSDQKALFEELDRNMKGAIKDAVKQCGIDSDCTIEIENDDFIIFKNSFNIDPQEAMKFYIKSLGVQHKEEK